ncbi:MAG: radical SAM protein [Myxococcales bacterium]|nr:radical SAM protein [Myxococcota bacterium]MDW8280673.1 radical SAM protein [Myxococcales bacterium]
MPVALPLLEQVLPVLTEAEACEVPFQGLDTLWLQLTGTLCNLACRHCFISCGPHDDRVPVMSLSRIEALLAEAEELGVKEYYLTGGEPMLHPAFFDVLERVLKQGPTTVLTNGLLIDEVAAGRFRSLFERAAYSLDVRVSLDGMTAAENDVVRGRGTFARIVAGIHALSRAGLSPVLTVVEHSAGLAAEAARQRFLAFARSLGLKQPRVKFLPLVRIGRGARHTGRQGAEEAVREPVPAEGMASLQCSNSRLATEQDVRVCPILLDAPHARLGQTLREAHRPVRLRWASCATCVYEGLSCRT